uniref:Uncharacterized protein n=1 Tax=Timema shepardi TaxID=629360 RepID=A0A7R9AWA8_TIMSH|nr:unnamed protein product [Timema shepardi]
MPPNSPDKTLNVTTQLSKKGCFPGSVNMEAPYRDFVRGCYSPVTSLRESLSRNGSNPKENKDKRNLERLLAGSEFSLTGQDTDLELDYYDYNVSNAGAVPGSYLGMDPAYLVWIPPFAPGCWEEEDDELLRPSERDPYLSQLELRELTDRENPYSLRLVQDLSDREQNNHEIEMEEVTQLLPRGGRRLGCSNKTISNSRVRMDTSGGTSREKLYISDEGGLNENDSGTLKRKRSLGKVDGVRESPAKVHYQYRPGEKETQVEKSPSGPNEYYDIMDADDDIKFADDEDEEDTDIEVDKKSCDEVIISELNHIKVYD